MVAMETGHFLKMLNDASLASLGFLMWKVLGYIICKKRLRLLSCKVNPLRCQTNWLESESEADLYALSDLHSQMTAMSGDVDVQDQNNETKAPRTLRRLCFL